MNGGKKMKRMTLMSTLLLSGMLLVGPISVTNVAASEIVPEAQLLTEGETAGGVFLKDGETLSMYGETFTNDEDVEFFVDDQNRTTASVRTWSGFRSAINNSNVSVINVTSSFNSALTSLNTVNRAVTINFLNNSTINMNNNHSLHVGFGGHVHFNSSSNRPIVTNGNQVRQPFIQGVSGSTVSFSGNTLVVGNEQTRQRQQPFIRTDGLVQIDSGSQVIMNEAIVANQLNVINNGSLTVNSNILSPVQISTNGRMYVGEFSTFKADHTGGEPVVKVLGSGHLTIDNPYQIHLRQTGSAAYSSPLIHTLGTNIQINAVRNAFWANNNFGPTPTHAWTAHLQTQLSGANGSQVVSSNINSFTQNFLGFNGYREYTAGSASQLYPDTFPSTESMND